MTPERIRAIAERCAEDMGAPEGIDCESFIAAAIETAIEEAGRPVDVGLRDRFAMAALASNPLLIGWNAEGASFEEIAGFAYGVADAMLVARKR